MNFWWRLELDAAGKVVSSARVEKCFDGEDGFIYVEAPSLEVAGRKAFNEYYRIKTAARRATLAASGKCRCGRVNDRAHKGKTCCTICSKENRVHAQRTKAKARGESPEPANRLATIAARTEEKRQEILVTAAPSDMRLALLLEVRKAWIASPTLRTFGEWLNLQIETAGGKRVA